MNKNMKKYWIYLMLFIFFSCGCLKHHQDSSLERISIAFQQWVGYGLFYLGRDKGFFEEEGVDLVIISERLDSARRDAFKRKALDCEAGTIDLLVTKISQNTPIVAVMKIDHSAGSDGIVARQNIRKIEDLIGKKVAFARDDVGETFISFLFHKKGLSLNDVIIVPSMPDNAWLDFVEGRADAVVTWEPWLSMAIVEGDGSLLISTKEEPGVIIDTLNVRRDLIEENPELIKGVMRGWFKALKFYRENPVEASDLIAKYYNITSEQYRSQVEGLMWEDYHYQIQKESMDAARDAFSIISDIKFKNKKISKILNAKDYINTTLIKHLYENIP